MTQPPRSGSHGRPGPEGRRGGHGKGQQAGPGKGRTGGLPGKGRSGGQQGGFGPSGSKPDDAKPSRSKPAPGAKPPRPAAAKGAKGPKGPRAFGNERFGRNLGPVQQRKSHGKRRPTAPPADQSDAHDPEGVRLQKVLAGAGVASRRVCEEMIRDGRVEVDGNIVTELGVRVDPRSAVIHVDGIRVQLDETLVYYVFNKPKGVVSSMDDPEGRPCITDYLKKRPERLFHVGRLDIATEGLLLLTNDGELANRLTHPSYEVPKTYLVQVRGPMAHGVGAQMRAGVELDDGTASVDSFKLVDSTPGHLLVEVVIHSGRNRVVRRLFDAVGHPVERLVRVQVGPIRLNDQRQGSIRALGNQEVGHLLATVGM
ncbi:pseudouridine synthase [Arthrobacter sp. H14]|uniref:pseudouridine synthase n=1 Tax=Arthrobacter sp. H14 TaxID=1312959 RepID=UPI00047ECA44|nr:pseudouridine synthase [Arthrobacter sp. H14]